MHDNVHSRSVQLDVDIDQRIGIEVWTKVVDSFRDEDLGSLASLVRLVYGLGYCDALTEPERGALCKNNGFLTPRRRSKRAA
jgi:hypothetical protein